MPKTPLQGGLSLCFRPDRKCANRTVEYASYLGELAQPAAYRVAFGDEASTSGNCWRISLRIWVEAEPE